MTTAAVGQMLLVGLDDETVYRWFHEGRGTESTLDPNAEDWLAVCRTYTEVAAVVGLGLVASRASWSGSAADGAHGTVDAIRAWADHGADAAKQVHDLVRAQSDSFNETKARLLPPVPVPDKPWLNDVWPGDTNYDQVIEAKRANSIRSIEIVRAYGVATSANGDSYPRFAEPGPETASGDPTYVTSDAFVTPGDTDVELPRPGDGGTDVTEWSGTPQPPPHPRAPDPDGGDPSGDPGSNPGREPQPSAPTPEPAPTSPNAPNTDLLPTHHTVAAGVLGDWRNSPEQQQHLTPTRPDDTDRAARPAHQPNSAAPHGQGLGAVARGAETRVAHRSAAAAGGRPGAGGGTPGGLVPGSPHRDPDDVEHANRYCVLERHEDFWDDNPAVAPPVIGGEED